MPLYSLKLAEFSDFDLLYALEDTADEEGWATAEDVAKQIGISHEHPTQCVGSRFAWLLRYGVLESKIDEGMTQWRMNESGYNLLHPSNLPKPVRDALEAMTEGQRLGVTDAIAQALGSSSREAAHLSRRAWMNRFGGWRDESIAPSRSNNSRAKVKVRR